MTAAAAASADSDPSELQVHIVIDDRDFPGLNPFPSHQCGDCIAAQIHIGLRFLQQKRPACIRAAPIPGGTSVHSLEILRKLCQQPVHNHESHVMSRAGIFFTGISKPCNQQASCKIISGIRHILSLHSQGSAPCGTALFLLFTVAFGSRSRLFSSFLFTDDFRLRCAVNRGG